MTHDCTIIGGGIVGLATAMALLERHPGARLVLLEKENALATYQTGHNSGVIHSGIYYASGSLKADLCKRGERATKEFCMAHGIPFVTCGKTLVATNALELERLDTLVVRAQENGIDAERLDETELRRREPNITAKQLPPPGTGLPQRKPRMSTSQSCLRRHNELEVRSTAPLSSVHLRNAALPPPGPSRIRA